MRQAPCLSHLMGDHTRLSTNFYPNPQLPNLPIQGHVLNKLKLCHVLSNHLSPSVLFWSTSTSRASVHLLFTCPNHLDLVSLFLFATEATPALPRITLFLNISLIVCPHIHLIIFISSTFIFWVWTFLIGQHPVLVKIL